MVAPSSAPILVMVALCGTERFLIPSPPYSNILETPPLTVSLLKTSKTTSFPVTIGLKLPMIFTLHTLGTFI